MQFTSDDTPKSIAAKLGFVALVWLLYAFFRHVGMLPEEAIFSEVFVLACLGAVALWAFSRRYRPKQSPRDQIQTESSPNDSPN
jgi:hypothetical protein